MVDPSLGNGRLPVASPGFDVLVVRSTKVKQGVFAVADRLALVIRAGAGTNTIDTAAAAARGVLVANVPGRNSAAVAELTMGLLLAVDRRIPDNVADLRAGRWNKKTYSKADGLLGTTMGIVGLGSIGLGGGRAGGAFGIKVQARGEAARGVRRGAGRRARDHHVRLAGGAALHLRHRLAARAVGPDTQHLWTSTFLGHMRPGAILLNTSRGDVVDEAALLEALDAGRCAPGSTSTPTNPARAQADWESALAQHPERRRDPPHRRLHRAGAARDGRRRRRDRRRVHRGQARNCVNLAPSRLGSVTLTVRHLDRPGVLARVLDLLSVAGLNVEHMENRVFRGGEAAMASIDVAARSRGPARPSSREIPHVLGVSATPFEGAG